MAEKKATVTFDAIMRDLKSGKYAPVYILMGDESYYIDRITDYIAENVLDPDDRVFNQTVVFGADTTAAQVVAMAKGYPVMPAAHRVVIVKEAQGLKSLDALERYFEKPLASTLLVIAYKNGTIDRRKKVVGKAEAVGVVFESKKKRDYELPTFIETYLKKNHVAIDPKSAAMIAEHIGADLSRLISELDKVMLAMPTSRTSSRNTSKPAYSSASRYESYASKSTITLYTLLPSSVALTRTVELRPVKSPLKNVTLFSLPNLVKPF